MGEYVEVRFTNPKLSGISIDLRAEKISFSATLDFKIATHPDEEGRVVAKSGVAAIDYANCIELFKLMADPIYAAAALRKSQEPRL